MVKHWLIVAVMVWLGQVGVGTAQTFPVERGSFLVNGSGSLRVSNDDYLDRHRVDFAASPSVLYFPNTGEAYGVRFVLEVHSVGSERYSVLGLGPAATIFLRHGAHRAYPYLSFSALFRIVSEENVSSSGGAAFRYGLGYDVFVSHNVAVNFGLEMNYYNFASIFDRPLIADERRVFIGLGYFIY